MLSLKSIFYILFLVPILNYGQSKKMTFSIYYASNVWALNDVQRKSIDSVLAIQPFEFISLIGYADTVGNKKANLEISFKRAREIETYIHLGIPTAKVITNANGEKHINASNNNLNNQRRVDIVFEVPSVKSIEEVTQKEVVQVNKVMHKEEIIKSYNPKVEFTNNVLTKNRLTLDNLLFEPGTTTFLHNKIPNELYYLANIMDSIPTMTILIEGHVCCVNDMKLSTERAKSVYLFLRGSGIDKGRMNYKGFSNSKPLVQEKTNEDQQTNRRVEIVILTR